jgi:hypothetical protein
LLVCRNLGLVDIARNIISENLLMVNFIATMRFRIGFIAVVFSLSARQAQACSCAVSDPGSCQVPVGDIIIRATVLSKECPYKLGVAAPPGRQALWGGGAEYPGTGAGTSCAMNFEVFWDGRISGTVIGRDGQPASGMITAQYAGPEPAQFFGAQVKDGRFEILRLPPGRYRLMFLPIAANRPAGPAVYYPGTQAQDAAALIEVGEGTHVEGLMFTIF